MSRISFVLLVVIAVILSTTIAQDHQMECGENQEYTVCGSACPPSCNGVHNRPCTLQCVPGCQCKPGLMLNTEGNCVSQC